MEYQLKYSRGDDCRAILDRMVHVHVHVHVVLGHGVTGFEKSVFLTLYHLKHHKLPYIGTIHTGKCISLCAHTCTCIVASYACPMRVCKISAGRYCILALM